MQKSGECEKLFIDRAFGPFSGNNSNSVCRLANRPWPGITKKSHSSRCWDQWKKVVFFESLCRSYLTNSVLAFLNNRGSLPSKRYAARSPSLSSRGVVPGTTESSVTQRGGDAAGVAGVSVVVDVCSSSERISQHGCLAAYESAVRQHGRTSLNDHFLLVIFR